MTFHPRECLQVDDQVFDVLMPLHLRVDSDGIVRHMAPTLAKLCSSSVGVGDRLFDIAEIRTTRILTDFQELEAFEKAKLKLRFREGTDFALKGVYVPLPEHGAIVNMSLGISMREIVRVHGLTADDFAPTDSTVDMLYLIEANTTAWDESRRLTQRLQGAKQVAEKQAFSDALTGLKNRRALEFFVRRMIEENSKFSLMNIDLDFFKQVNDTLGHAAGDHVLQSVAKILLSETRNGDIVARVGGDEFVVAFYECVEPLVLEKIGTRIIRKLERPIQFEGNDCKISASIGTTLSTYYDIPDLELMQADADKALYCSKRQGRAQHTLFDLRNRISDYSEIV